MQEGAYPKSQALGRLPMRSIRETILGAAFSYADVLQKKNPGVVPRRDTKFLSASKQTYQSLSPPFPLVHIKEHMTCVGL
jgi:hypothetical protein